MNKRKVFIAIHQLNFGGAQKALLSALNAIDYEKNEVTLYVRKDRLDLLPLINKNITNIIINRDNTKYYRKPYSVCLTLLSYLNKLLKQDVSYIDDKHRKYIVDNQIKYEKKNCFAKLPKYDIAISYIQGYTAKSMLENINAEKKVMFYHDSTDSLHDLHNELMSRYDKIYCVSKGALEAVSGYYPVYASKMDYLENYLDAENIRKKANEFKPAYPKDKLILCSCGRITAVKGYDIAVNTAEILRDKALDFKWYFVGDGAERANIDKLIAEKNLNEYIKITGLKDNPYPYIKNCDIYVQPSYEEAHPLSIIEAQILVKPVVSTATVGGNSIILDALNGLISDINSKSLAEKILQLKEDKLLQDKIKQELEKKDYSNDYQTFCRKWEKLLEGK